MSILRQVERVKKAQVFLGALSTEVKNKALINISAKISERSEEIIKANESDLERSRNENLGDALLKRLKFNKEKIREVREGIESLVKLDDPVGKTLSARELDDGLELFQVSCPIGVIGMIFESRPDALVQIATLCLKSGNGVILKGGAKLRRRTGSWLRLSIPPVWKRGFLKDGLLWRKAEKMWRRCLILKIP